jgi:diguanylate cyclase (GGDEF)-like protein/PAS domain S-box-containing protein
LGQRYPVSRRAPARQDFVPEENFCLLESVAEATNCAIYSLDLDGLITGWNQGAVRIYGYQSAEVIGRYVGILYNEDERASGVPEQRLRALRQTGFMELETTRMRADGTRFAAHIILETVKGPSGAPENFLVVLRELMSGTTDAARLAAVLTHDPLTGLLNRQGFRDRLGETLADRRLRWRSCILFVNLDDFKTVNGSFGSAAGDEVLQQMAQRLRALMREGDILARLGGDMFAVILHNAGKRSALSVAARMVSAAKIPFNVSAGKRVTLSACIGISGTGRGGASVDVITEQANLALFQAKTAGPGTIEIFRPDLRDSAIATRALEEDLRQAVETGAGLAQHYQPIFDLATGRVACREALIRWTHAERGPVSPTVFIPVVERLGLIRTIGYWVLVVACRAAAGWADRARVAINVSPLQLVPGFADQVAEVMAEYGLAADRLEIEITESALLDGAQMRLEELHRVKALGVSITLDDFGIGFSSLAHIRAFPFSRIKIDGSFVRDAIDRPECAVIVGIVAELGRRLGMTVVAEGVETQAQLDLVRAQGCHEVQGFFVGRPGPDV